MGDGHDGDSGTKVIKCLGLEKKKEKNKKLKAKVYLVRSFFGLHSRHHRGCE
jgi:hypothetical protein